MDADLKLFINGIIQKTGIKFSIYDSQGEFLVGSFNKPERVPVEFTGVKAFENISKTLFRMKFKAKTYIGCLDGVSQSEKNYAHLISDLAESSSTKEYSLSRGEFYESLLAGELNISQISRYARKFMMKDLPAFVMIIRVDFAHFDEVKSLLDNLATEGLDFIVESGINQLAFVKIVDEQSDEYHSSTEYAEFLKQSIYEETGVVVHIAIGGTVKTISELSESFSQAMAAVRMCNAVNSKGEIHTYKEYVLVKMLEDLPKYTLSGYLETLMDSGAREIFDDEEMVNTAEEFLENSLNVSETSRKLYLHRNTLTYRLDKIERATGLNIRKFSDAVTFRLITILSRLVR